MDQPYFIPKAKEQFLDLGKPIVFFDLETTGTNITSDRIVEICAIKLHPGGSKEEIHYLLNPTIPIPPAASEVHGITDDMVAGKPTFEEVAGELSGFFSSADLGGFNIKRFDVPILMEEFHRCKMYPIQYSEVKIVDACAIFHGKEKRDLSAAVRFYCDKEHGDAHSAKADVLATIEVLKQQLMRYDDLEPNTSFLHSYPGTGGSVDFNEKFIRNESGEILFNFGPHKGKLASSEPGFLQWMLGKGFPIDTRMVATRVLKNLEWQKEIKGWLDKQEVLLDLGIACALYTTVKFDRDIQPFVVAKSGKKLLVTYNKQPPAAMALEHQDAVGILLRFLEGYFEDFGGYEVVRTKLAPSK